MSSLFYTSAAHEYITSSTSVNIINWDLDSYLTTTYPKQTLNVDCVNTSTIDTFGLWINNYTTSFNNAFIALSGSANGTSWTKIGTAHHISHNGLPLWVYPMSGSIACRYYRLNLTGLPSAMNVSQALFLRKRDLTVQQEKTSNSYPVYINQQAELHGLRKAVRPEAGNYITKFENDYVLYDLVSIQAINNIIAETKGTLLPFVVQQSNVHTLSYDYWLCRMEEDQPNWQNTEYLNREVSLVFSTLPYIEAGKNY